MESSVHLRRLILAGMLASMATMLKLFSFTTGEYSLRFYEIPLFFGGMILGPGLALIMGFAADWGYIMLDPRAISFNLMTISAMLWGFSGALFFYQVKRLKKHHLAIIIIVTSALAFSINSVQLYLWLGSGMWAGMPARLITMVLKWPLQIMLISILHERVFMHIPFSLSIKKQ